MLVVQNQRFKIRVFCGSIATNDELVQLFQVTTHMEKSKFLDLPCPKQVQLLISICIHGKFCLSTTFGLVGF
jgi:hypothetical protein